MEKRFLLKLLGVLVCIGIIAGIISLPVEAFDVSGPDQLSAASFCYRNLLETGDFFLVAEYQITYLSSYPTVPASDAYVFRLFDPTDTTELADSLPYVFTTTTTGFTGTNGYGYGAVAFYFDAADAPAWGEDYIVNISGNPTHLQFSANYQISSKSYNQGSGTSGLAATLRLLAKDFSTQWNVPLLTDTSSTSVFTADGESYFRNAIPGLQSLAPGIFESVSSLNPDTTETLPGVNNDLSNTYQHRFDNSWVHTSLAAGADLFHLPLPLFVGIFCLAGCIFMIKKSNDRFQSPVFGYFGSFIVVMGFSLLFLGLTLLAILLFIGGFLVANALFFRKA